jgi:putative transposase
MSRPYRLQSENCFYHITSRGDDRKKIFVNERDHEKFLEYILLAKAKYKFRVYAYCLMSNHYHLLLETPHPNISKIMHYINGSYTTYYNIKRGRSGHVFQGRFKSLVVDKDSYFLELSRYIHLNPVKAKIVEKPEQYRWSSYLGYLGRKDPVLDQDCIKQYLGMDKNHYVQFVLQGIDKSLDPFKNVYAGFILGSVAFIKESLGSLGDQIEGNEIAYKEDLNRKTDKDLIIRAVMSKYNKTLEEMKTGKTRPMKEKQMLIYLLRKHTGLTNKEIGDELGMKFSAVSKTDHRMEQLVGRNGEFLKAAVEIMSNVEV